MSARRTIPRGRATSTCSHSSACTSRGRPGFFRRIKRSARPATVAASLARDPVQVLKSGTTVTLYGVAFPSLTAGWVVGGAGTILATTNGGASWKPQKSGSQETLYDVAFPTPKVGWAVGSNGAILKTTDGGAKWAVQKSGTIVSLYDVTFLDDKRGWIAGADGTILSTDDGGASWQDQPHRRQGPPVAVLFLNG